MTEAGDKFCNLECAKGRKIREFVGPVKIILVDPKADDYWRRVWGASLIAIANLLIGATVLITVVPTLNFYLPHHINIHIATCTVGFQLLMPSGILMTNPLFGGSVHLQMTSRKCQHAFLQFFTLIFGVGGTVFVLTEIEKLHGAEKIPINAHTITGTVAAGLACLTALMGPCVYFINRRRPFARILKRIHTFFGLSSFISSSLCMCSGLLRTYFEEWSLLILVREVPQAMYIFCTIYTIIIIMSVYWNTKVEL